MTLNNLAPGIFFADRIVGRLAQPPEQPTLVLAQNYLVEGNSLVAPAA